MPNKKKEQLKKPAMSTSSSDEFDDSENGEESTDPPKSFLNAMLGFFKHLFPAFMEAFASGTKTFKRRVQGITEPEQNDAEEDDDDQKPGKSRKDEEDETAEEDKEIEPAAGSKKRKLLLAFIIALIIIPVACGLYLGGMFNDDADGGESDKPVSAAPQEDSHQKSVFDSIFGKKNQPPATPAEQLAAMQITINPNNFVKYAGQNDINVVQLFIQSGMSPNTRRPLDGFTPLTAAAAFGRQEMAEFLLDDNGADINAQDHEGQTALMKAVQHNRPQMVELLLERKADYNIADKSGNTALTLANTNYGDNPLTKAFEKFGIDISTAKKETAPEKKPESLLPSPDGEPAKNKTSPYLEVSVQEFLKLLETEPASVSESTPK